MRTADQQLHNILTQLRNRFKDHERLMFLALLDPKKFASYRKNFPSSEFQSLAETCGLHCDLPRLKTELTVMNNVANFEARSPSDLLHFLTLKELTGSMLQLHHLTCLVLTIPMSTSSVERSFSALKRIKTHARNSPGQDRLGALALMSMEEGVLLELYDAAISHFTKKDRRMDFVCMKGRPVLQATLITISSDYRIFKF